MKRQSARWTRKKNTTTFRNFIRHIRIYFLERRIDLFGFFADKGFVEFSVKILSRSRSRPCRNSPHSDQTILAVLSPSRQLCCPEYRADQISLHPQQRGVFSCPQRDTDVHRLFSWCLVGVQNLCAPLWKSVEKFDPFIIRVFMILSMKNQKNRHLASQANFISKTVFMIRDVYYDTTAQNKIPYLPIFFGRLCVRASGISVKIEKWCGQ